MSTSSTQDGILSIADNLKSLCSNCVRQIYGEYFMVPMTNFFAYWLNSFPFLYHTHESQLSDS